MARADDQLREIMKEVTETLTVNLRDVLASSLERQLTESLTQSLLESEFYRRVSKDMRSGLRKIYKEMNAASQSLPRQSPGEAMSQADSERIFQEASEQLSAVLKQTEQATVTIMEIVEKHMDFQEEMEAIYADIKAGKGSDDKWARLAEINGIIGDNLNQVMTALSFQDLTGQRIKKVVSAIRRLESTVLELYLSSGLLIKGYEEGGELSGLEEKTKATVEELKQKVETSELQGPSDNGASQGDIDDLLAQFGL